MALRGIGRERTKGSGGAGMRSRGALRAQRLRRVVLPFIRHTLTWFGVRPPAAVAMLLAPLSRSLSCGAGAAVSWRRPRRRGDGVAARVAQAEFFRVCHTKAQYDEEGPRIARHNAVFSAQM